MGEHKRRSRNRREILESSERCVYCSNTHVTTIEHMPPRSFFKNKDRPSGWEFACCERCNKGSRGADAVAQFMASMEPVTREQWKVESATRQLNAMSDFAPGVIEEIFGRNAWRNTRVNSRGIIVPAKLLTVDGPITRKNLDIFSAKAAMAAFHRFTGRPLKEKGFICTEWFLNAGLSSEAYNSIVSIMPGLNRLEQGKKNSGEQFFVRYNTNEKDIVAALLSFHVSLHISVIATDGDEFIGPLNEMFREDRNHTRTVTTLGLAGLEQLQTEVKSALV